MKWNFMIFMICLCNYSYIFCDVWVFYDIWVLHHRSMDTNSIQYFQPIEKHVTWKMKWSNKQLENKLLCSKIKPVRIRVRIRPQHPLALYEELNGTVLQMGSEKTEAPCHSRCGTIKIPPCSKALGVKHRPKFCSPSDTSNGDVSI
jgi:hypothetical protein